MMKPRKILTKKERIRSLENVQTKKRFSEKRVYYKSSEEKAYDVYEIPLECLIYNKYNGRILSMTTSFENQSRDLNPENPKDDLVIEEFLWNSKIDRNEFTMKDIKDYGQREYGIVTRDGIIIDGNRRAMILNRLCRSGHKNRCTFRAIILEDEMDGNERSITQLETSYQMGQDEKLDYNPIEKYLKCHELSKFFDTQEIAGLMSENVKQIKEWAEIKILMDDYLEDLGYSGIYTRLEKREGHFVDLNRYLKVYEAGTKKLKWAANKTDFADLKAVYFDYIRVPFPVQACRIIGVPGEEKSFFCNKKLWKEFRDNHFGLTDDYREKEMSVEQLRKEYQTEDLSKILEGRDDDWRKSVEDLLEENKNESASWLNLESKAKMPAKLITKAKRILEGVDAKSIEFSSDRSIPKLIKELEKEIKRLKE